MALNGSLQDMSLRHLARHFRSEKKSGMLVIIRGSDHGIVYVAWGRIIDAIIVSGKDHRTEATGTEAVINLFTWKDAAFSFHDTASVNDRPVRIKREVESLFEESQQRIAAYPGKPPRDVITLDTQLRITPLKHDGTHASTFLSVDEWRILSLIARLHNLRAICKNTHIETKRAIEAASRLVSMGLLEIEMQQKPSVQQPPAQLPPVQQLPSVQQLSTQQLPAQPKNKAMPEQKDPTPTHPTECGWKQDLSNFDVALEEWFANFS